MKNGIHLLTKTGFRQMEHKTLLLRGASRGISVNRDWAFIFTVNRELCLIFFVNRELTSPYFLCDS